MSHATITAGNGTAARRELVEALEAVLQPGQEVILVQPAAEEPLQETVKAHEPKPRIGQGVIRVRREKSRGCWSSAHQRYLVIRGLSIDVAKAVAVNLNLRKMLNNGSTKWHAVIHTNDNDYAVVRVVVPKTWKPEAPTDWPCGAEVNVKAVRSIKERNRGPETAEADAVDWWVIAYRLD